MKLLLIGRYSSSNILTGPEKVALNLFLTLHNRGLDPTFITYYFNDLKDSTIINRLFGTKLLSENPPIIRYGLVKILIYLLYEKPQVLHIITFERFLLPIIVFAKILRIKIIYTVHGIVKDELKRSQKTIHRYWKDLFLEWLIFHLHDKIVFLSNKSKLLAEKYYKLDINKITFIPNGVSQKFFLGKANKSWGNKLNVVFYNGITENIERGLKEVINLLDKEELYFIRLYVIGNENNIVTKHLDVTVVVPMTEDDFINFLLDKNIFLMSTTPSTFSLITLECMALGLIVIISDAVGISEYIKNGINGFIYQNSTSQKVINVLNGIKNGSVKIDQIIKHARQTCMELRWELIADQYLDLYNKVIYES